MKINHPIREKSGMLSVLLKLGVIASSCIGILQHDLDVSDGFMNSIFMAFTIESNIWIAAICFVFLVYGWLGQGKSQIPGWLYVLKYMFTTAVLLTWFTFAVLLTPMMSAAYLLSASNLCLHNLTPMLTLLDFLNFDSGYLPPKKHTWLALVMPLLYTLFFFTAYEIIGKLPVQYFFLDYKTLGWFSIGAGGIGVVYWIALLLLVCLAIGGATLKLQSMNRQKPLAISFSTLAVMIALPLVFAIISMVGI